MHHTGLGPPRAYSFAFGFATTRLAPLFSSAAASPTMSSTIFCAGSTSWIIDDTRPISHGRVFALISGFFFSSASCGRMPCDVSSRISAWRLLFLRRSSSDRQKSRGEEGTDQSST
jgi:hypothetical protein